MRSLLVVNSPGLEDLLMTKLMGGDPQSFRVLSAATGKQALEISSSHTDPIHLVVTNYELPDLTGLELAREIARASPTTRVVVCLLKPQEALMIEVNREGHIAHPFVEEELEKIVRLHFTGEQPPSGS